MAGIEGRLDRGQGEGAALGDLEREGVGLLFQLAVGYHLVDQAHLQRIARGDLRVAEPEFLGSFLADQVFEVPGAVAGIE